MIKLSLYLNLLLFLVIQLPAGVVRHWVDAETGGREWVLLQVENGGIFNGLLRSTDNVRVYALNGLPQESPDDISVRKVDLSAFSHWWHTRYFDQPDAEPNGTAVYHASEKGVARLRIHIPGEGLGDMDFMEVARQSLLSETSVEPFDDAGNNDSGRYPIQIVRNVPVVEWFDEGLDTVYQDLRNLFSELEQEAVSWMVSQLRERQFDFATKAEHTIRLTIFDYEPRQISFLIHGVSYRTMGRTQSALRTLYYRRIDGQWIVTDPAPANPAALTARVVNEWEGEPLELQQPEVEPYGWLPGGIGIWESGVQESPALGEVWAIFARE